jgi:hypothetical protein
MRRIIERKVTVVTTTTWTISWQDAPPQPSSTVEPASDALSNTNILPAPTTPDPSTVIEIKEADSESAQRSDENPSSLKIIDSHQPKLKGNKK